MLIGETVLRKSLDGTENFKLVIDKRDPRIRYIVTHVIVKLSLEGITTNPSFPLVYGLR